MKLISLIYLFCLCIGAQAAFIAHDRDIVEHERREDDDGWVKLGRVDDAVVPVQIGLRQQNLDKGHEMLMNVSDPSSENYGRFYTLKKVHDIFAPSAETIKTVREWLESEGIANSRLSLSINRQWVKFNATTAEIGKLWHTTYYQYYHESLDVIGIGCDSYKLPTFISERVDYIAPAVKFGHVKFKLPTKKRSMDADSASSHRTSLFKRQAPQDIHNCSQVILPDCIRKLYNVHDSISKRQKGNSLGIFERGEAIQQEDLNTFFTRFAREIPNGTYPIIHRIDGGPNPRSPYDPQSGFLSLSLFEAAIDFESSYPLAYPDDLTFYQVDDEHYEGSYGSTYKTDNGIFNTWLDAIDGSYCTRKAFGLDGDSKNIDPQYPDPQSIPGFGFNHTEECGVFRPTKVISLSYEVPEAFYPVNYLRRQCSEFMKLGMQGVTVVSSTGDSGVELRTGQCLGPKNNKFGPHFPSTCPYVTSVGGTMLPENATAGEDSEVAADFSSGGFSVVFPRPDFQYATLKKYFARHNPPYPHYTTKFHRLPPKGPGLYNRAGRGIPDLSANGGPLGTIIFDEFGTAGGTSESAPIVAGIVTRINNGRLAANKSTLGWINPALYAKPHVLNDIVQGNNPGCNTTGFESVPGWDPVTGLGTPDYGKMKRLFLSLP